MLAASSWPQQNLLIVYLIDLLHISCKPVVAQIFDELKYTCCRIGWEITAIRHGRRMENILGQFEALAIPLGDLLINEWISVEDMGSSWARRNARFIFKLYCRLSDVGQ